MRARCLGSKLAHAKWQCILGDMICACMGRTYNSQDPISPKNLRNLNTTAKSTHNTTHLNQLSRNSGRHSSTSYSLASSLIQHLLTQNLVRARCIASSFTHANGITFLGRCDMYVCMGRTYPSQNPLSSKTSTKTTITINHTDHTQLS